jgi:hypothetical protein
LAREIEVVDDEVVEVEVVDEVDGVEVEVVDEVDGVEVMDEVIEELLLEVTFTTVELDTTELPELLWMLWLV